MNIKQFVAQLKETGETTSDCFVRGRKLADQLGTRELRGKKHTHQAVKWDELGNVTVLTARGQVLNLTAAEAFGS